MNLIVEKSKLEGKASMPSSKSHTIRAIAVASLASGESVIRHPLNSQDAISAAICYRMLGASIDNSRDSEWIIKGNSGNIKIPDKIIDVGNSGTTLRLAIGSATLCKGQGEIIFTGDEQIQSRPIAPLLDSLNDLGAKAVSIPGNGKVPAKISGTLKGGKTTIECVTSQYLSSLLMATPLAENDTDIEISLLNEPDYVQITLDWLDKQNIKYKNDEFKSVTIAGGQKYTPFDERIPADFSSATFFLCAATITGGEIVLDGLDFSDSQPDKAVAQYLIDMGAEIDTDGHETFIKGGKLQGIEIDMNRTPDALPAMAVTAAFAEGTTKLYNVAQARKKETDRISCMACELSKMGVEVEELPDGLIIKGGKVKAAKVNGHGDHRIVMALAMAGLACKGTTTITTAEAMNITFPNYVQIMNNLGAKMIKQS